MFGLGIWEVVVILAVALIVLGPRKLPEAARQLARMVREFRRATNELRYSLDDTTQLRPPVDESPYPPSPTERSNSKEVLTPSAAPAAANNSDEAKPGEPTDSKAS